MTRKCAKDCSDPDEKEVDQEQFIFSISLDTKERFETGVKFLSTFGPRVFCFFFKAVLGTCFNQEKPNTAGKKSDGCKGTSQKCKRTRNKRYTGDILLQNIN